MPKISASNETDRVLGLWVEPWGTDHWMRPQERFTVVTENDSGSALQESPFEVVVHDQGISVAVSVGFEPMVLDQNGSVAECGHQRPRIESLRHHVYQAERNLVGMEGIERERHSEHLELLRSEVAKELGQQE